VTRDDRNAGSSASGADVNDRAPAHAERRRRATAWSGLPHLRATLRPLLAELVAVCALLMLLWGGIAVMLRNSYNADEAGAELTASNLARAFEESTRRAISEIDQTLLSARAFYALQGIQFDVKEWARTQRRFDRMTVQIGMANTAGTVFDSTVPMPPGGVNIADRPHFRVHSADSRDELYISRPVVGRSTGQRTIQFSRKLIGADGGFVGVIVLSLGCDELSRFYDTLDISAGFVELVDRDGIILARGPATPDLIGRDLSASAGFRSVRESAAGHYRSLGVFTGTARIVEFRRLQEYPLAVQVGLDEATVFQPYHVLRNRLVAAGEMASAIILIAGLIWLHHRRRALRTRRALDVTLGAISQGILMVDEHGAVPVINQRATELLGLGAVAPDRLLSEAALASVVSTDRPELAPDALGRARYDRHRNDGVVIEVNLHHLASGGTVQTFTDVTEQRHAETRIRYMAHHDCVTGLPNRVKLREHMTALFEQDATQGHIAALMLIDLDGFKSVNDTLGHEAGDCLLVEVAQRLRSLAGDNELVTRIGGDEFVILVQNLDDTETVEQMAAAVLARLAEPSSVVGQQVRISASIGLAFYPRDGQTSEVLLRNADIALYRAKGDGRGCVRCFDRQMVESLLLRRSLETDLRHALEHAEQTELELHFQPQFSGTELRITGFEALMRWRHPTRGFIPPNVFIPIAEETGLIITLGRWVLNRACTEAVRWRPRVRVAINVSPPQLKDEQFAQEVADTLARTGLAPYLLEVEVTESVLLEDDERVLRIMRELKARNISIALDDFGTGYSSLSYLRRFPFDKIKIDRMFIEQLTTEPSAQAIMEAILLMGRGLDLDVIAEGIETPQQLAMVHRLGCSEVQGFLVGRPMPADQVSEFLRQRNARQPAQYAPAAAYGLAS
jgi:diguanylate cyclase (GGDEF)-like protein